MRKFLNPFFPKSLNLIKIKCDEKVSLAQEDLKSKAYLYHSNPSSSNKIMSETAKKSLDKAYLDAQEDFVNGKIDELMNFHINQQHSAAWKTIKELSGKALTIKGGSRETGLKTRSLILRTSLESQQQSPQTYLSLLFKLVVR